MAPIHQPSRGSTRTGLISGWALLTLIGIALVLGNYLPPPGPYDASTTAAFYHEHVDLKRFAMVCLITAGAMYIPFGAAIADRLRRIDGVGPVMATCQLGAAIVSATLLMVFGQFSLVALLRPDMPSFAYQLLNHVSWIAIAGIWQVGFLQGSTTAVAIFSDKSATPMYPRWVGWYSVTMTFGALMDALIPFFTAGPFAWNGVIAWWVAGAVYFAWFAIMLAQFHLINRRASNAIHPTGQCAMPDAGEDRLVVPSSIA